MRVPEIGIFVGIPAALLASWIAVSYVQEESERADRLADPPGHGD